MEEWAKSIGCEALREDKSHNLVGDATAEPTDESVASLFSPISMILAQFGTQIPVGSKIQVLCHTMEVCSKYIHTTSTYKIVPLVYLFLRQPSSTSIQLVGYGLQIPW